MGINLGSALRGFQEGVDPYIRASLQERAQRNLANLDQQHRLELAAVQSQQKADQDDALLRETRAFQHEENKLERQSRERMQTEAIDAGKFERNPRNPTQGDIDRALKARRVFNVGRRLLNDFGREEEETFQNVLDAESEDYGGQDFALDLQDLGIDPGGPLQFDPDVPADKERLNRMLEELAGSADGGDVVDVGESRFSPEAVARGLEGGLDEAGGAPTIDTSPERIERSMGEGRSVSVEEEAELTERDPAEIRWNRINRMAQAALTDPNDRITFRSLNVGEPEAWLAEQEAMRKKQEWEEEYGIFGRQTRWR